MNFSEFVGFIHEQADIVNDPLYGKDVLKDRPKKVVMGKSVSSLQISTRGTCSSTPNFNEGVQSNSEMLSTALCHLCSKNHKLYTCY